MASDLTTKQSVASDVAKANDTVFSAESTDLVASTGSFIGDLDVGRLKVAVVECTDFKELRTLDDLAAAMQRMLAGQAELLSEQQAVAEARIICQRKLGAGLRELGLHGGDRKSKSSDSTLKLRDLGVSKFQSATWQKLAAIADEIVDRYIAECRVAEDEITTSGLMRLAYPPEVAADDGQRRPPVDKASVVPGVSLPSSVTDNTPTETEAAGDQSEEEYAEQEDDQNKEDGDSARGGSQRDSGRSDEWYSPAWLIERCQEFLGPIDLDPAAAPSDNPVSATRFYTIKADGLSLDNPWAGTVYLNPPFSKLKPFVTRLIDEFKAGTVKKAVLVAPLDPSAAWWRLLDGTPFVMFHKRIRFDGPDPSKNSPKFNSVVFVLSDRPQETLPMAKKALAVSEVGDLWVPYSSRRKPRQPK